MTGQYGRANIDTVELTSSSTFNRTDVRTNVLLVSWAVRTSCSDHFDAPMEFMKFCSFVLFHKQSSYHQLSPSIDHRVSSRASQLFTFLMYYSFGFGFLLFEFWFLQILICILQHYAARPNTIMFLHLYSVIDRSLSTCYLLVVQSAMPYICMCVCSCVRCTLMLHLLPFAATHPNAFSR